MIKSDINFGTRTEKFLANSSIMPGERMRTWNAEKEDENVRKLLSDARKSVK